VQCKSGAVFVGSNIENISYGLTICAERIAVASAVAAGEREFVAIAVVADTSEPIVPCGACRQFLAEFAPELIIVSAMVRGGQKNRHIVKEIDALGGAMAINADATGIQFRILNRSKGEAVWATRVQCDKKAYQFRLKAILEKTRNLRLLQGTAATLLVSNRRPVRVPTDLRDEVVARSIVITAGTFLRGLLHVGEQSKAGGRMADTASSLSDSIRALGFEAGRFKTGTPCRLNGNSIDFGSLEVQGGDEPPPRLSFVERVSCEKDELFTLNFDDTGMFHVEQLPCWLTHTTPKTHDIISANLHRSPLYQHRIKGTGPRYCPSIEDKI